MITEFLSVYSHFCSKILRIWQKFAVEYCSYKGLTLRIMWSIYFYAFSVEYCSYEGLTQFFNQCIHLNIYVEYCSYKGFQLCLFKQKRSIATS